MLSRVNQDLLLRQKIQYIHSWKSEKTRRDEPVRFLDDSRFNVMLLTRLGRKNDLIKLTSYFALLKLNTAQTLQYRSKCSGSSISWCFWICKRWVGAQNSFSQSSWIISNVLLQTLPSIVELGEFLRDADQFNLISCFYIKEQKYHFYFILRRQSSQCSTKSFNEVIMIGVVVKIPQGLKKWRVKFVHAFLSKLLSFCLWISFPGHKLIRNRILLCFWRNFVDLYSWHKKSPACQREFLRFELRSSDWYCSLFHWL